MFKVILSIILSLLLALAGVVYYRYYFVFATGVKSGELNQIVKKGYLFKTYEGRLIQAGFRATQQNTVQSYEFTFSIEDENVAKRLERMGGKSLELHYKEYKHTLPWRGNSIYIVDSIVSVKDYDEYEVVRRASKKKNSFMADDEEEEQRRNEDWVDEELYDEVFQSEYYSNGR